jgi:hypothetical protein
MENLQRLVERPRPFGSDGGSGKKIALSLRTLKYEKELAQLKLPRDTEGLIHSMLRLREQGLEVKYNLAFHFTLLKQQGAFWQASGHQSLNAWLAAFDLPMGATLAMREHMVRLFSKETFMLAGDDILHEMLREVANYQKDPDKQKKDYQRIFDAYCKSNDAFDKAEFRKTLIWYVRTRYINPTLAKVTDNTAPLPKTQKGERTRKVLVQAENATAPDLPPTETAIKISVDACAGCKLWKDYATQLENIITSELGAKRLPKRPQGI